MRLQLPLLPKPIRYVGVLVVATLILHGSLLTVPETVVDDAQPGLIHISYWRHLVAYFTLACILAYATDHWEFQRWRHAAVVIALATLFGVVMEFGQAFLPHRSAFLITDVLVNAVGASGVLVWFLLRPRIELQPITKFFSAIKNSSK